jgi:hypothetical protein
LVHKYKSTFEAQCSFMHPLSNIPSAWLRRRPSKSPNSSPVILVTRWKSMP